MSTRERNLLHPIERNSFYSPYKMSPAGLAYKKRIEGASRRYSTFYLEFYDDENGNRTYRKHPNQG